MTTLKEAIEQLESMADEAHKESCEALGDNYTFADYGIKSTRKQTLNQVLTILEAVE